MIQQSLPKITLSRKILKTMEQMVRNDYSTIAGMLPSLSPRVEEAEKMVREHFLSHSGYVAWSGGKDSTCVAILANSIFSDIPIVWFDSGLEFPENRDYIFRVAKKYGFNFSAIKTEPDALTFLKDSGFWSHSNFFAEESENIVSSRVSDFHETLVSRPSSEAHAKFGNGELLGMRADESKGRKVLLSKNKGEYLRNNHVFVCCPIWRWNNAHVEGFLSSRGVEENPVYIKLKKLGAPEWSRRVGLVVDGNAAEFGRYTWLRAGWPDLWNELCEVLPRLKEWR